MRRQYLGDGVYVGRDDYQVELSTHNGIEQTNTIVLEPEVLQKFIAYVNARYPQAEIKSLNEEVPP